MDISWLGRSCVRIRTRQAAVVMDPVGKAAGYDMGRPTADIVTISRHHPDHDNVQGIRGQPVVIDGPGEYEISGVQIYGVPSPLPAGANASANGQAEAAPERNTTFLVEAEGVHVAHLGSGCVPPAGDEAELLGTLDILVLPIGGEDGIDPSVAARTVRDLEPTIVIPVGYEGPDDNGEKSALRAFLNATGLSAEEPEPKLTVQRRQIGEQPRVVLLSPRGS